MLNLKEGLHNYFVECSEYVFNVKNKHILNSEEVIVFIHGLACSLESYRFLFDRDYFADKSLLIPDLIGFGKSSKPEDFSYKMEDQAALIECLLEQFPYNKVHIVAHSMGGAVALLFSEAFMKKVDSFTNIEGNLIEADCGIFSRGVINNTFASYSNVRFNEQKKEYDNHDQLRFTETTPVAVYKSAFSLVKWSDSGELLSRFKNLQCRKCYIYGRQNNSMPVLKLLEDIKTFVIPDSGHALMTENPEHFYSCLSDFIIS